MPYKELEGRGKHTTKSPGKENHPRRCVQIMDKCCHSVSASLLTVLVSALCSVVCQVDCTWQQRVLTNTDWSVSYSWN